MASQSFQSCSQNVGDTERWISGAAGGVLLSMLSTRSLINGLAAVLSIGLIYRAVSGHCPMYEMIDRAEADREDDDEVANLPAHQEKVAPAPKKTARRTEPASAPKENA